MAQFNDTDVEEFLGKLLRTGVIVAGVVVAAGGLLYLARHGMEHRDFHTFRGEPEQLRSIAGILKSASRFTGRGIIQLGLLIMIATPVTRVAVSAWAFALERDGRYVVLTLIVLALLLYSLFGLG